MNEYLVRTGTDYYYGSSLPQYTKVKANCFVITTNGYIQFYDSVGMLSAVFACGSWEEVIKVDEV